MPLHLLHFMNRRRTLISQSKKQSQNALLSGPVRPALLRFAGPIILSMVATQLYTVADTMIVGLCLDWTQTPWPPSPTHPPS